MKFLGRLLSTCFYSIRCKDRATKIRNCKFFAVPYASSCFRRSFSLRCSDESIRQAARLIETCQKIVVVCGAGISTPSGLPDFRSPGTGLYDNLDEYELVSPSDVFDINFFRHNPYPFFRLAKSLYPGNYEPNEVHYFMKMLSLKKKLQRVYTQNIDALEATADIPSKEIVFAHGSFHTATCTQCKLNYSGNDIKGDVMNGILPICKESQCEGIIKPDVVFFGEDLPASFHYLGPIDLQECDFMLILGTSLEVFPVAGLVYQVPKGVSRFLMNKEVVEPFLGDYQTRPTDLVYCGDLVKGVCLLVDALGWKDEFNDLLSQNS